MAWFDKETIDKMLSYENSGFSLDAKVRIQSWDRGISYPLVPSPRRKAPDPIELPILSLVDQKIAEIFHEQLRFLG